MSSTVPLPPAAHSFMIGPNSVDLDPLRTKRQWFSSVSAKPNYVNYIAFYFGPLREHVPTDRDVTHPSLPLLALSVHLVDYFCFERKDSSSSPSPSSALTLVGLSDAPWLNRRRPGSLYSIIEYEILLLLLLLLFRVGGGTCLRERVCLLNEQRRWHLQIKTRGSRLGSL